MRARTLAEQAREGYAKGEVKAKVAEVDDWLRARAVPASRRPVGARPHIWRRRGAKMLDRGGLVVQMAKVIAGETRARSG